VFENWERRIYGSNRETGENSIMSSFKSYSSLVVIGMIILVMKRPVIHEAHNINEKYIQILARKSEGSGQLGRPQHCMSN
jgi:hypothetical protein